jgi:cyclopropane-fatty-acyl-phospholipid synthase
MWNALFAKYLEKSITKGALAVTLSDGSRRVFGEADAAPVELIFHDPKLPQLVVRSPDLAIGEGYMDGRLTIGGDDLVGFMTLAVKNFGRNNDQYDHPSSFKTLSLRTQKAWRQISQYNPVGKAQANVAHHYDLSDELYDLFLDEDRQYSCAYYKTPGDTLEQAQRQKKDHIARKLRIEPGMRVLDIGCGWGGMGLTLAQDYGATVVGVTLSKEQHKVATQRVHDAGLEDQVDFRLQDYRHLSEQFDRIVSVGMFEHVGVPHYDEYFRTLRDLLSPDGVALSIQLAALHRPM